MTALLRYEPLLVFAIGCAAFALPWFLAVPHGG